MLEDAEMLEDARIEFKRQHNDKVNKVLLSFLNTDGGTLFIGVDDDGSIFGVDNLDKELLKTVNSFRDSVTPDPSGYFSAVPVEKNGKLIIEVSVERGSMIPYCFKSYGLTPQGVYVRVGSESVSASREHIKQLIRENDGEKFIEALSLEQNLSFVYASHLFAEKGVAFGESQMKSLGLIRTDSRYSNLALVISNQNPYTVKAAIFDSTTKEIFKDRKEFTGSVFKQIDEVLAYLNVYNKVSSTFDGAYRVDRTDYPEIALREALINAMIHRDFYIEGSILVSVFTDRLEIMSLGGTMPGVTKELLLAGVSVPRNEKLAAVFFRLKLIEAYGTGIPRIFETYKKFGATPSIPITNGGFQIVLPNLNSQSAVTKPSNLRSQEVEILKSFAGRTITKQKVAELLGISNSGAYKLLQRMTERGVLTSRKESREIVYLAAE
jgi:ATP-dependent DNA helicase RecG